jgi:hypothetical protein
MINKQERNLLLTTTGHLPVKPKGFLINHQSFLSSAQTAPYPTTMMECYPRGGNFLFFSFFFFFFKCGLNVKIILSVLYFQLFIIFFFKKKKVKRKKKN